jgi:hypothetical protein
MTPGRLRAGVVIALIVVCGALAGAAVERVVFQRMMPHRPGGGPGGPGRGSPEQDSRRRTDLMDRMTKELDLSTAQRAGIDSVMKRTDSSLRVIRTEMQPRLQQVFQAQRAEIEGRLDSVQRVKFVKTRPQGRGGRRP